MAALDYARHLAARTETPAEYADLFLPGGKEIEGEAGEAWAALYHGYRNARHQMKRLLVLHETIGMLEKDLPDLEYCEAINDLFDYGISKIETEMMEIGDEMGRLMRAAKAFAPDETSDEDISYP